MSPRKVELYEIIANRLQDDSDAPAELPQGSTYEIPLSSRAGRRNEREVILSLDAAFVMFVVFLLLLGTSYLLGVQAGGQQARRNFAPVAPEPKTVELSPDALQPVAGGAAAAAPDIRIPKGRYTLRIAESDSRAEILSLQKDLLKDETVRNYHQEVFVFVPSQAGDKYILALGQFASGTDEGLLLFQKRFSEQNNERYKFSSPELIDDLKTAGYKIIE